MAGERELPHDDLEDEVEGGEHEEAGQEDDEGQTGHVDEDDAEGDERVAARQEGQDDAQGDARQVERQGRKGYGDLRREAREAREETARLRQRLDEFERQSQERQSRPDPELERQRLELMTPEERIEYRFNQAQQQNQREMARIQVQMWDSNDRANFNSIVASNPTAARYKDEVERLFRQEMQAGRTVSRETVLAYVIGQSVLKRAPQVAQRQRREGQGRIDRQRVQPANGRSTAPARRQGEMSLEEKLADVQI